MSHTNESLSEMAAPPEHVVGVQFERLGEIYFYRTKQLSLKLRDSVIAKRDQIEELGEVIVAPAEKLSNQQVPNTIMRKASQTDILTHGQRLERAREALALCRQVAAHYHMPMKFTEAHLCDNDRKLQFTFTADDRVDFRTLIKELSSRLRMRVEMKQIGARDEAKLKGAIGSCGNQTCCSGHIREFKSIGIAMAKDQQLSPNPTKLGGVCGKLKCCLAYEHELYRAEKKGLPKIGKKVRVGNETGEVVHINVLKRLCEVRLHESNEFVRVPADELRKIDD